MELDQGIAELLDGNALLFLGAGFSCGATNLRGSSFPTSSDLAAYLATRARLSGTTDLEDAAEVFAGEFGVDALMDELRHEFTAKDVEDFHRYLSSLPWNRIYTTNYDNVVETGARLEGRDVTPVTPDADIYGLPKDHVLCIHLNGYVDQLDRETIWTSVKLTDSSYLAASLEDSQWAMLLRQDVRLAGAVFFVGYSMYDLDIRRLLLRSDGVKDKSFFFVGSSPDDATLRRVSKFGTAIRSTAAELAATVMAFASTYEPRLAGPDRFLCLREHVTPDVPVRITDEAFLDLFLHGHRTDPLLAESLRTGTSYFLERTHTQEILDLVDEGNRVVVISSDLGNGKSMILEGIRVRARERGFRVFDVIDDADPVGSEIEAAVKIKGRVMVIVENYPSWLREIRIFCSNASDRAVLLLTARNALHDVMVDDLMDVVGEGPVSEVTVDHLDEREVTWIVETLDTYGLWGDRAGDSRSKKLRFIGKTCNSQMHAVLLKLLSSPHIAARLKGLSNRLRSRGEHYRVLVTVLVATLLNHRPTMDMLADIWGTRTIYNTSLKTDPVINEVISVTRHEVLVRSPVLCEFLLRTATGSATTVGVLKHMAQRLARGGAVRGRYRRMFTSLMRYSSLQLVLPEDGRGAAVASFYESIKNLRECRTNPQFWLQYAISSLVNNDLHRAKSYFDTAYSYARQRGTYDTYRIDNHYARYLLVNSLQQAPADAIEMFRSARSIINRQIRNERRHYPYRVAIGYREFVEHHGRKLAPGTLQEVSDAATTVLERIETLPDFRQRQRHVRECKRALEHVSLRCKELMS